MATQGNYVYFGSGAAFIIADVSDPANPLRIGELSLPDVILDIAVSGDIAVVANEDAGLRIVDISNPVSPLEVGSFITQNHTCRVEVQDGYAYVVESSDLFRDTEGLRILDISTPSSPREMGYFSQQHISDVEISRHFAFLACEEYGVRIVDIVDPSLPVEVGFINDDATFGSPVDIKLAGNFAYVASKTAPIERTGDPYHQWCFWILDISEPSAPERVSYCCDYLDASSIALSGSYAYIIERGDGIHIIDISSPSSLIDVGFFGLDEAEDIIISGNHAYVGCRERGLHIVDISIPLSLKETGILHSSGRIWDIFISGNYAYLVGEKVGLQILDISMPSLPVMIGYFDILGANSIIVLQNKIAYVASYRSGVWIIDITDPASPVALDHYEVRGAQNVVLNENILFVLVDDDGLIIFDISDPSHPVEIGSYYSPGRYYNLDISGNYLYLTKQQQNLMYTMIEIIDISSPTSPGVIGQRNFESHWENINVYNNHLFLYGLTRGICVINIFDPYNPVDVTTWDLIDSSLVFNGRVVFSTNNYYNRLQVYEISDLTNPIKIESRSEVDRPYAHLAVGDSLYVSYDVTGLQIFDISGCSQRQHDRPLIRPE